MKIAKYITFIFGISVLAACSDADKDIVDFKLDADAFEVGPEGGTRTIRVSSPDSWIATTDDPWITVSPANGKGSTECQILIDSALTDRPRTGVVRIQNRQSWDNREITVSQEGYAYSIEIDDNSVSVDNYAAYGERYFDVKVRTNVDFDIEIPDNAGWLKYDAYKVEFDRGIRPREVNVRFNWTINSMPLARTAEVVFRPKSSLELARQNRLDVEQLAAPPIEENTRAGDSVAMLSICRSLETWSTWEDAGRMENWDNVTLWEEGMEGYTPDKAGRVKQARFMLFSTREGLPYEVQYLTAAEDLTFYSNTNAFRYSLETGEYITKLTQLKRLTIGAYGLTSLHEDFKNLVNLEYLDLASNNFERIPEMLTPENFPNLHALRISANQRNVIYDLSNNVRTNFGGLYEETSETREFPRRLLSWDKLDTLILSVNYLQGTLPTFEDDPAWPRYTQADVDASRNAQGVDTLPQAIIGLPKVMPMTKRLSINLNRLTGEIPQWMLYHPALDWWEPFILVFNQEGKDQDGNSAGFSNEPANLNYYYNFFPNKKLAESYSGE